MQRKRLIRKTSMANPEVMSRGQTESLLPFAMLYLIKRHYKERAFMSILHNKLKDRFVQVPNALVTDNRISIPARLIYVYLASKPDGWIVRNGDVMKNLDIRNAGTMAKYWHELETSGWIIRHKTSAGTYDYELNETEPIAEKPNVEKTAIAKKPNEGKTATIYNTDSYSNTDELSNIDSNNTPYNPPTDEDNPKFPFVDKDGRLVIGEDEFGYIYAKEPEPDTCFTFDQFWNAYGKKVGKPKCEKLYAKIKEADRAIIKKQLPKYVAATPDIQYRKHPQTWLNGQCWNDEIIDNRSNDNGTAGSYGRYVPHN